MKLSWLCCCINVLLAILSTQVYGQCPKWRCVGDCSSPSAVVVWDISPDGQWVVTSTADGAVWLWDVRTGEKKTLINCLGLSIGEVAFDADSQIAAIADAAGLIRIVSIPDGNRLAQFSDTGWVQRLKFVRPDLLISSADGLSVWNWRHSKRIALIPEYRCPNPGQCCAMAGQCFRHFFDYFAISSDGALIATSGREKPPRITIWTIAADVIRVIPLAEKDWVSGLSFQPDNPLVLLSANSRGDISAWNVNTGKQFKEFGGQSGWLTDLHFINENIFVAANGSAVRMWDFDKAVLLHEWVLDEKGKGAFGDGKITPNLQWAARRTGESMRKIEVWNVSSRKITRTLDYISPHDARPSAR